MALQQLSGLGTYEEINGGAHRTAASIIGIPALLRHLGFWYVQSGKAEREGDGGTSHNAERWTLYGNYIRTLRERIDRGGGHIVAASKRPPPQPDSQPYSGTATLLRFWWHGMLTTLRLEYHTEYVTLTSIIDLHLDSTQACSGVLPDCPRYQVTRRMKAFNELFEGQRKPEALERKDIGDFLQLGIWEAFEREVIDWPGPQGPILGKTFGEVFLDSRGIVTGTEHFQPPAPSCGEGSVHRLRTTFAHRRPRPRMREGMEHDPPDSRWAPDTVRRIWQFIEAETELADTEFTVTGFLGGRVVFITALGPPSPSGPAAPAAAGAGPTRWTPVRYFLHAHPDDEWQFGRLIDRINTLGTMRLAATMEIRALRVADGLMENLLTRINRAAEAIQLAMKGKGDDPTEEVGDIGRGYKALTRVVRRGVLHRLERSQYYLEQFRKECGGLDEKPVEGFQTYSEFVTRRMGSIFGYLQYLATRMQSIDSANSSLERQYSWLKIASVTGEIGQVVKSMNNQDAEIEKIQEFGEFALIGALIPYYVGSALTHSLSIKGFLAETVWAVVILVCSIIALIRVKLQKEKDREAGVRWWWLRLLFWGYFAIVLAAYAGAQYKRFGIDHEPLSAAVAESFDKAADH